MKEQLEAIWRGKEFSVVEIWAGLVTLLWGIVLIYPTKTFQLSMYLNMSSIAEENSWGGLLAFLGVAQIVSFLFGNVLTRRVTLWTLILVWAFIAKLLYIPNCGSFGYILISCVTLLFAWTFIRMRDRG